MRNPVLAAGAVLTRPAAAGLDAGLDAGLEVCLVHRPAYDDWSLPKGKLETDELSLTAAVRELFEETGVRGQPQLRLPGVSYVLPDGRPKTVEFWLMRALPGEPAPVADPDEVDEVAWLPLPAAHEKLSYDADRDLVRRVGELPPITAITPLVRHAHAGERKKWNGNDALRPLSGRGQADAVALAEVLTHVVPEHLVAATPLRCKQTLEPLAGKLGLPIVTDNAFAEPAGKDQTPARVREALVRLAELRSGPVTAICSQGKLMPALLAALAGGGEEQWKTAKGEGWVIAWSGETVAAVSPLF